MALLNQTVPERHFYRQWTVARGDRQTQSFNRIPAFVPSWGMTELVAPGICGDPNSRRPKVRWADLRWRIKSVSGRGRKASQARSRPAN